MEIVGKVKKTLTFSDVKYGQCFHFLEDETLYLMGYSDGEEDYIIDIQSGRISSVDTDGVSESPVELIDAVVVINGKKEQKW